jgi:hypothetical protein
MKEKNELSRRVSSFDFKSLDPEKRSTEDRAMMEAAMISVDFMISPNFNIYII